MINKITFDYEIVLLDKIISVNEFLQEKKEIREVVIFADKRSVSRNEFYLAKKSDMQPSIIFIINSFEYNNQKELLFNLERYKIIKTYELENELLELTCEKVILNE